MTRTWAWRVPWSWLNILAAISLLPRNATVLGTGIAARTFFFNRSLATWTAAIPDAATTNQTASASTWCRPCACAASNASSRVSQTSQVVSSCRLGTSRRSAVATAAITRKVTASVRTSSALASTGAMVVAIRPPTSTAKACSRRPVTVSSRTPSR